MGREPQLQDGIAPSLFTSHLYQTQVTGLISLALVIIRLSAGSCTALLVWRKIFILLDKRVITLTELVRLDNYSIPIVPQGGSRAQMLWSCWAVTLIVLLWPSGFAAPLANSSVAWIPSIRLSDTLRPVSLGAVGQFADWASLGYDHMRMVTIVNAALMASKDPTYAFNSTELPLRRYFPLTQEIPENSTMNLTLPYFDVSLRWIDAASDNRSQNVDDPKYGDLADQSFAIRDNGTVAVIRSDRWDAGNATPKAAAIFSGTKLISVKVSTLNIWDLLPNGSAPTQKSACSRNSDVFGRLPDVGQQTTSYFWGGPNSAWAANDCFLIAEASITAGKYNGKDFTVSPTGANGYMATCNIAPDLGAVEEDWISGLSLDFMSETMKYIVMLNLTQPFMHDNLDSYTTSMLKFGYDAAWSSLMKGLGNASEPTTVRSAESVVRATVDRTRLGIWLAMSAMLSLSALLEAVAQNFSTTKTVRDTTLAAVAMDLTEVTHSGLASGLCSAVVLSKEDHKLPRLKWTDNYDKREDHTCRRRVVFAENKTTTHGRSRLLPDD